MKKYIRIAVNPHLEGRCLVKKCEGQYIVPIHPKQKAKVRGGEQVAMGKHTATCGHEAEIVAVL